MQTASAVSRTLPRAYLLFALFIALTAGCIAVSEGSTPGSRRVARRAAASAAAPTPTPAATPTGNASVAAPLRLISWNMEWLNDEPGRGTVKRSLSDYQAFAGYAAAIDADIAVLQEVDSETAVQRVFDRSRYNIYVTQESGVQRVALVWKNSVDVRIVGEVESLGPGGLRESPDALVKTASGPFRLLGVHLKSGCFGRTIPPWEHLPLVGALTTCGVLADQMDEIQDWMETRHAEGVPFAVAGDFNRRFSVRDDVWERLNASLPPEVELAAPTLAREAHCRDGRYPQFIDHIVMSGTLAARMVPGSFRQWNYRSWDPPTLSDHCPIGVELR